MRVLQLDSIPEHSAQDVLIDGELFHVELRWSTRGSWYVDLRREDGTDLLLGRRLTPQAAVFSPRRPRPSTRGLGGLIVGDRAGRRLAPGRDDLGTRHALIYVARSETSALIPVASVEQETVTP